LLLVGLVTLGMLNLDRMTRDWGEGIQLTIYLQRGAPADKVAELRRVLAKHPVVASTRQISSDQAYRRLKESLASRSSLLEGVERDFLPASLELGLRQARTEEIRPLLALLKTSPIVDEVDHVGRWVKRLGALASMLRLAGLAIAVIVCLACLYIVGSTIRLGVFARRDEIEILKLVGATNRFVRAPFLIEGALQGLIGAVAACALLYLLFQIAAPRVEELMATALSRVALGFLTPIQILCGIGAGALLGLLGSRLAVGRYVDL
jgi:cell division transport system permease protein